MKTIIYHNYNILGKGDVYSVAEGNVSNKLEVEIPDDIVYGLNDFGEIILIINGEHYLFNQLLCGCKYPHILIPSDKEKYIRLKITNYFDKSI